MNARMRLSKEEIRNLLAKIYYNACLDCGTDMKELADVLEYISGILTTQDGYLAWNKIKLDRQRFDKKPYIQYLSDLRQDYFRLLAEKILSQIRQYLDQKNYDAAFGIWKKEYLLALATWRSGVYIPLCNVEGMPAEYQATVNRFRQLNKLIIETNWVESYPYFCELAGDPSVDDLEKSCFQITAGQIQLYWMPDYKQSLQHFEEAARMAPANGRTLMALGEYYTKLQDFEKARSYLLTAISMDPYDTDNYLRMGDSYKDENKFDAAEQWYTDALNTNFLESTTYSRMILLYGDPSQLESHRDVIDSMVKKVETLEPNNEFSNELYHCYRDTGHSFLAGNDVESARIYYQKAVDLRPELPSAMIDLANMYTRSKDFTVAEQWFKKAISKSDNNFDAFWGLAWFYEQQKKTDAAEQAYTRCLELRPSWGDSVFNFMGVMFDNNQQYDKALTYYKKATSFGKKEPIYFENLRDLLVKMNRKEELESVLVQMHELFPENAVYAFQLGQFYDERQQTEKALKHYRAATHYDPSNPTYFESVGLVHEKLGQFEEAEKNFLKSNELQENYLTCNRLGIFYYQQQDYEKAIDYYKKAISLNEADAVLWGNLGLAYEKQGNVKEAEEAYYKAIDLNLTDGGALNRLGLFYYNQKEYNKAIAWYKQALEKEPDHVIYLENLALAYDLQFQWSVSLPIYQKLVHLSPDDPFLTWRLGVALYNSGKIEEALQCFLKIRSHYSNDVVYLEYLGYAYELTGDPEKAVEVYNQALEIVPADEYFNNRIGILFYNKGDEQSLQKAAGHYQKAILANPVAAVYYYNQALAYASLKTYFAAAEESYRKAIKLDPGNDLYYNQFGVLYHNNGRYAEALEQYKKAIELKSTVPLYFENMGLAYKLLNDTKNSKWAYAKAKEVSTYSSVQ